MCCGNLPSNRWLVHTGILEAKSPLCASNCGEVFILLDVLFQLMYVNFLHFQAEMKFLYSISFKLVIQNVNHLTFKPHNRA